MKLYKIIFIGFLCLLPTIGSGQTVSSCTHCSMTINDEKFIASAIDESGDFLRSYIGFDALVLNIQLAVGAEFGVPLYQNYYGISMNEEFTINAGLKNSIF